MVAEGKESHIPKPRVLFFGLSGILSRVPLTLLINAGVDICGLVLPAAVLPPFLLPENGRLPFIPPADRTGTIPLTPGNSMLELAAQHQLPLLPVQRLRNKESVEMITAVAPDIICVSCFDQILPPAVLAIPRLGCLNLHPSLLPQFRGPAPLFWQMKAGLKEPGVTVHFMDEGIDTGDIALQAALTFVDGLNGAQIEQMCAERGGRLLLEAVQKLAQGALPRQPQPAGGSYQPAPTPADFFLDSAWSARRAFNFMRATKEFGWPYRLQIDGRQLWLAKAVAFQSDENQGQPIRFLDGNLVALQFSPGVLIAQAVNKAMPPVANR